MGLKKTEKFQPVLYVLNPADFKGKDNLFLINGKAYVEAVERIEYEAIIPAPKPVFWASIINYIEEISLFIDTFFIEICHIPADFIKMLKQKKHKRCVPIKVPLPRISQKMKNEKHRQWIIERATRKKERLWLPAIGYAGIILAVYFHLRPNDIIIAFFKTTIGRKALEITGNHVPIIKGNELEFVMFSSFMLVIILLTIAYCIIDTMQNLKEKESECVRDIETGITINGKFTGNPIDEKYLKKEELN